MRFGNYMYRRYIILVAVFVLVLGSSNAQTGGNSVYNFLSHSYSTRLAALGNGLISVHDSDPSLLMMNPSSIRAEHSNMLALNFTDYLTNSVYASVSYAYSIPKAGNFVFDLRHVGYGKFRGADETGTETGDFYAGDIALGVGWGRELSENFSIGANFRLIFSNMEAYNSFGFAVDVAGSYYNPDKNLSLTLLAKNIGSELKPYTKGHYERIPFDLQFAISQRLQHVPLRYHISLHSLYRWNMNYYGYDNPFMEMDAITNTLIYPTKASQFFDNFFRHFIFGVELEPSKYFSLQFAYNHNAHQEMKVVSRKSFAGFSYGFQLNIKGVRFGFSRLHFAPGNTPNCLSLALDFNQLSQNHQEKKAKKLERVTD